MGKSVDNFGAEFSTRKGIARAATDRLDLPVDHLGVDTAGIGTIQWADGVQCRFCRGGSVYNAVVHGISLAGWVMSYRRGQVKTTVLLP